jgi:acetamidase/formamidase
VQNAEPGDVLRAEVLVIQYKGWGWSAHPPHFGLLADESEHRIETFGLRDHFTRVLSSDCRGIKKPNEAL